MSSPTPAPSRSAADPGTTMSGQETIVRPLGVRLTTKLETGAIFANRYEVIHKLGEGGMGIVYSAKDQTSGLELVLKLIHPDLVQGESAVRRLMSEGLTAREIRHPNIVAVYDVSQWGGQPYFTMEYVRGRNLRSWLVENLNKDLEVALDVAAGLIMAILAGLAEAHRMGIVHRDLKPENILLRGEPGTPGFQLKIVDFGIAKAVGATRTSKTSFSGGGGAGTPLYMAPEQMTSSEGIKPSADLYSLSVMLYEMLMDALPQARFEPVSKHRAGVPAAIDALIEKGLAVRPRRRFQTAAEYVDALDKALGRTAVPAAPAPAPVPVPVPVPAPAPDPAIPEPAAPQVVTPVAVQPSAPPAEAPRADEAPRRAPAGRIKRWLLTGAALVALTLLATQRSDLPFNALRLMNGLVLAGFTVMWFRARRASSAGLDPASVAKPRAFRRALLLGVVSPLGTSPIVTVAGLLAITRLVPGGQIPGTLAVGLALPLAAGALTGFDYYLVYYGAPLDVITTVVIAGAAALGAWHGAGVIARWAPRRVMVVVGVGLLVSAISATLPLYLQDGPPFLRDDMGLVAVGGSFALGMVSAIGFSVIAPLAILFAMVGTASWLALSTAATVATWAASAAGVRYMRARQFDPEAAFGLAVGAVVGLLAMRLLVENFGPMDELLRLATMVIAVAGGGMQLRSAMKSTS
jgi:hypothetical protein